MPTEYVFVNGEIALADEAGISVFDHGFLYGDALFETMRAYGGRIFKLEAHLDRLWEGARFLRLEIPWSRAELKFYLLTTLRRNNLDDAYLRLVITRGTGPLGLDGSRCKPGIVIYAKPLRVDETLYEKGIRAIILQTRRNPTAALPAFLKSSNFLNNILGFQEVQAASADEGIFLNMDGQVSEATTSNLFIISGGILKTPSLNCGLLPGISRVTVLDLARFAAIPVEETVLHPDDLFTADEVFVTNSIKEVLAVVEIDRKKISDGLPGAMTKRLWELYRKEASNKE